MKLKKKFRKLKDNWYKISIWLLVSLAFSLMIYTSFWSITFKAQTSLIQQEKASIEEMLNAAKNELEELKNQDQVLINEKLADAIENIEKTYDTAVGVYENLLELKESSNKTGQFDELFTEAIVMLSEQKYASASSKLNELEKFIKEEQDKIAASFTIPATVPKSNAPPGAGYSRQSVTTDAGTFMVSMIAADLGGTRVIVDTASDSDCGNDCPVLPLSEYVSRNGAFAGVNGSYFCPATYPSCAGKTNTFDLLVMNHKKTYFNSGNNVYSNNPVVIFGDGYIRFVTAASQWGRDTSPNGVLSNFPMLVFNNNIVFGGDDDPKKGSKGARSFIANKGNTVYIGVVHSATVAESARAMSALGMENAMNLDNGGSTALWSGGYKVGPGRNLPNVILFVGK
jgi:exopolysaccharide biosynthesis protein